MDDSLERELVAEYPDIFAYYDSDFDDGLAPNITLFGFECDNGWYSIIDGLCEMITNQSVSLKVVQVKEKFGGLRFYYQEMEAKDERRAYMVNGAVQMAQEMSFRICEMCGQNGELREDDGWYKTRCDSCFEDE